MGNSFLFLCKFSVVFKTVDCAIDLAPFCDLKAQFLETHSAEAETHCALWWAVVRAYVCVVRKCVEARRWAQCVLMGLKWYLHGGEAAHLCLSVSVNW